MGGSLHEGVVALATPKKKLFFYLMVYIYIELSQIINIELSQISLVVKN